MPTFAELQEASESEAAQKEGVVAAGFRPRLGKARKSFADLMAESVGEPEKPVSRKAAPPRPVSAFVPPQAPVEIPRVLPSEQIPGISQAQVRALGPYTATVGGVPRASFSTRGEAFSAAYGVPSPEQVAEGLFTEAIAGGIASLEQKGPMGRAAARLATIPAAIGSAVIDPLATAGTALRLEPSAERLGALGLEAGLTVAPVPIEKLGTIPLSAAARYLAPRNVPLLSPAARAGLQGVGETLRKIPGVETVLAARKMAREGIEGGEKKLTAEETAALTGKKAYVSPQEKLAAREYGIGPEEVRGEIPPTVSELRRPEQLKMELKPPSDVDRVKEIVRAVFGEDPIAEQELKKASSLDDLEALKDRLARRREIREREKAADAVAEYQMQEMAQAEAQAATVPPPPSVQPKSPPAPSVAAQKSGTVRPNEPIPTGFKAAAVRDTEGNIHYGQGIHTDLAEQMGVPLDKVKDTGWVVEGQYYKGDIIGKPEPREVPEVSRVGRRVENPQGRGVFTEIQQQHPEYSHEQVISAMEERIRTAETSPVTGLPKREVYDRVPKKAVQAAADLDGLKWVNDNIGHEDGNSLLKAYADALREEGVEAYHIGGDEFAAQGDDEAALSAALGRVAERFRKATFEVKDTSGKVYRLAADWSVSHATGPDYAAADAAATAAKRAGQLQGTRPARGEPPTAARGILEGQGPTPPAGEPPGGPPAPPAPEPPKLVAPPAEKIEPFKPDVSRAGGAPRVSPGQSVKRSWKKYHQAELQRIADRLWQASEGGTAKITGVSDYFNGLTYGEAVAAMKGQIAGTKPSKTAFTHLMNLWGEKAGTGGVRIGGGGNFAFLREGMVERGFTPEEIEMATTTGAEFGREKSYDKDIFFSVFKKEVVPDFRRIIEQTRELVGEADALELEDTLKTTSKVVEEWKKPEGQKTVDASRAWRKLVEEWPIFKIAKGRIEAIQNARKGGDLEAVPPPEPWEIVPDEEVPQFADEIMESSVIPPEEGIRFGGLKQERIEETGALEQQAVGGGPPPKAEKVEHEYYPMKLETEGPAGPLFSEGEKGGIKLSALLSPLVAPDILAKHIAKTAFQAPAKGVRFLGRIAAGRESPTTGAAGPLMRLRSPEIVAPELYARVEKDVASMMKPQIMAAKHELKDWHDRLTPLLRKIGVGSALDKAVFHVLNGTGTRAHKELIESAGVGDAVVGLRQMYDDFADRLGLVPGLSKIEFYVTNVLERDPMKLEAFFRNRYLEASAKAKKAPQDLDRLARNYARRMTKETVTILNSPSFDKMTHLQALLNHRGVDFQGRSLWTKDTMPSEIFDPYLLHRMGTDLPVRESAVLAANSYIYAGVKKLHFDPLLKRVEPMLKAASLDDEVTAKYIESQINDFLGRSRPVDKAVDRVIYNLRAQFYPRIAGAVAGAFGGGVTGAAVGSIFGAPGTGAIIGAAQGGLRGAVKGTTAFRPFAATRFSSNVAGGFYRGALGLALDSATLNLTQSINTITDAGLKNFLVGVGRMARDYAPGGARETGKRLKELGVLDEFRGLWAGENVLSEAAKSKIEAFILSPFNFAELVNRGIAFHAYQHQAAKAGLSAERTIKVGEASASAMVPGLTVSPREWKALEGVRKTQFAYGPADTPGVLQGPVAQLVGQFTSYPRKQLEFMAQGFADAVKENDNAKLLRYYALAGFFTLAGTAAGANLIGADLSGLSWRGLLPPGLVPVSPALRLGYQAQQVAAGKEDPEKLLKTLRTARIPGSRGIEKLARTREILASGGQLPEEEVARNLAIFKALGSEGQADLTPEQMDALLATSEPTGETILGTLGLSRGMARRREGIRAALERMAATRRYRAEERRESYGTPLTRLFSRGESRP